MRGYYSIKNFLSFLFTIPLVINCAAAGDTKNEYKTDPATGIKYLFFKHNEKGEKPVMGDVAYIRITYKTANDSLLFDSHSEGRTDSASLIPLTLRKSFEGCLEQGVSLMAVGDSASFLISADSIYLKAFRLKSLPPYIKQGSELKFYIKLVKFKTAKELNEEEYALIEKHREEMKKMQNEESTSIEKYLKDNKITVKPTMIDSLYILEHSGSTKGKPVEDGDSVVVKYTGQFLNGTVFDQSDRGDGGKGTFKFLLRYNAPIIRGWIEVLLNMHEGEKERVLFPSSLAYGPIGAGKTIRPFTPLLFEIEVVKVISPPFNK